MFTVKSKRLSDDEGSITIFMVIMMLTLVLITGLSIEVQRYEHERISLQDALDRGALATASLQNEITGDTVTDENHVKAVVSKYVDLRHTLLNPDVSLTYDLELLENSRSVSVLGDFTMNTIFLRTAGVNILDVAAASTAEERIQDIEISIVLDVSGSMHNTSGSPPKTRIQRLRDAATEFVNDIYLVDSDDVPSADNIKHTSVSLIPFNHSVNISALAPYLAAGTFPDLSATHIPDYTSDPVMPDYANYRDIMHDDDTSGYCASLQASDYSTTTIPTSLHQIWPTDYWNSNKSDHFNKIEDYAESSDCVTVALNTEGATYERTIKGITYNLINEGFTCKMPDNKYEFNDYVEVDDKYEPRWKKYEPSSSVVRDYSILCPDQDNAVLPWNNSPTELKAAIAKLEYNSEASRTGIHNGVKWGTALLDPGSQIVLQNMFNSVAPDKPKIDKNHIDRPFAYGRDYTEKYLILLSDGRNTDNICYSDRGGASLVDCASDGLEYVGTENALSVCQAAKDEGITIFTIAFDLTSNSPTADEIQAKALLENCASGSGNYFDVSGAELGSAFKSIADSIQQLKLVQ